MTQGRHTTITSPATPASPWRFTRSEWQAVLRRSWHQTMGDDIDLMAAGVAFYGFLALVPLLGAVVLLYGLIATPNSVVTEFRVLTRVMPIDAARLVRHELLTIITASDGKKGFGLALSLGLSLFGARSGAGAIIAALNLAYEEQETRSFLRLNLTALAVTATGIVIALAGIAAVAALTWLEKWLPTLPAALVVIEKAGSWLTIVLLCGGVAAALYRIGPDRACNGWIWLTPGAVWTAACWTSVTVGFGSYIAYSDHYNATYGSLSAVVVILTWFYLSSFILLIGAELNSECERQVDLLKPNPTNADGRLERKLADIPGP